MVPLADRHHLAVPRLAHLPIYNTFFSILPQPQKECGRMFFVPLGMGERGCVGRGNKEKEKKAWRPMVYSCEFDN